MSRSLRVADPLLGDDKPLASSSSSSSSSPDGCYPKWRTLAIIIMLISTAQWCGIGILVGRLNDRPSSDDYQPGPISAAAPLYECAMTRASLAPLTMSFVSVPIVEVTVLSHVRVIDGNGSPPVDNQRVTFNTTSGKIMSIINDDPTAPAIPSNAHIIDATGMTMMPGMVGMHQHLFYPSPFGGIYVEQSLSAPRLYLAAGVTSMRTSGSINGYTDINTKILIDAGSQPGPHIHITAPYLDGPGNPVPSIHKLESSLDARRHVDFWANAGATSFKAYMWIAKDHLKTAIQTAHARGLKVTGHLCSIGFTEAAELGIDHLEHGLFADTEFNANKRDGECPPSSDTWLTLASLNISSERVQHSLNTLVAHQVGVVSTLSVLDTFIAGHAPMDNATLDQMLPASREAYIESAAQFAKMNTSIYEHVMIKQFEWERAFFSKGGLLMSGADPTGFGGVIAGFADQHQLELLVEAGFTPLEAIRISTWNGAIGLGVSHCTGRLSVGMNADMILVNGNPSVDISDVRKIVTIFKDGIGYNSTALRNSVKGLTGWL